MFHVEPEGIMNFKLPISKYDHIPGYNSPIVDTSVSKKEFEELVAEIDGCLNKLGDDDER